MTKIQTIRVFKKFLKKNNAYDPYCKEMGNAYIFEKLMSADPYSFVSGFFAWDMTAMGYKYWIDLSAKWYAFLDHNNKQS